MRTSLGSVAFISLGCPKNLIDSESMLGALASRGYVIASDYRDADVVVINTCGFLDASRQESLDHIRRMTALKKEGSIKRVVVAGCMVGNYRELLDREAPGVDALLSVNDRTRLTDVLIELADSGELARPVHISDPDERGTVYDDRARLRLTPKHYAYLRIAEGCDHKCSFCTIPGIRGRYRSKPRELIIEEAREMVSDGAKELIIVAQDSTYYGMDSEGRKTLHELLAELAKVEGLEWIRLMYAYPTQVSDDLIELLATEPKLLGYIDMPLQHISTPVLKRMQRGATEKTTRNLVAKLRERVPGLTLRSTFIVGFPGETEAEFESLLEFMKEGKIDRAGAFGYSDESQAGSFALEEKLPQEIIDQRYARFMETARDTLFASNESLTGSELTVLVEGGSDDPKYPTRARSKADAPEIDCGVLVRGEHAQGSLIRVKVERSLGFDLLCGPVSADRPPRG